MKATRAQKAALDKLSRNRRDYILEDAVRAGEGLRERSTRERVLRPACLWRATPRRMLGR